MMTDEPVAPRRRGRGQIRKSEAVPSTVVFCHVAESGTPGAVPLWNPGPEGRD